MITRTKEPKPKKCPNCGAEFRPFNPFQKTCGVKCALEYNRVKNEKKAAEEVNEKVKAFKSELLGIPELKNRLQNQVNKIVRLIDKGHPCISSGASYGTYTVHAGHFYPTGSNGSIRFNLLNIYAQSDADNLYKSGNQVEYRASLIKTFGPELVEEIDTLRTTYQFLKLTKIEMISYCALAQRIALRLEKANKIYSTKERIELRREFNKEIGVYL